MITTPNTNNPERALILKAARRWDAETAGVKLGSQAYRRADARLTAFGEVAADVLDMCLAPFAFTSAIRSALLDRPQPRFAAVTRDRAADLRADWEARFLSTFNDLLTGADVHHASNMQSLGFGAEG